MYQKLILIFLIIFSAVLFANPGSEIKGKVIDGEIKQPLTGVNIYIKDTQTGTTTDEDGNFNIADIPSGMKGVPISLVTAGILMAPLAHRLLHRLHLDMEGEAGGGRNHDKP